MEAQEAAFRLNRLAAAAAGLSGFSAAALHGPSASVGPEEAPLHPPCVLIWHFPLEDTLLSSILVCLFFCLSLRLSL